MSESSVWKKCPTPKRPNAQTEPPCPCPGGGKIIGGEEFLAVYGTGIPKGELDGGQLVLGRYFSIFLLARPPGAMVPESSIVLHFRPALAPLPVSDNLELVF